VARVACFGACPAGACFALLHALGVRTGCWWYRLSPARAEGLVVAEAMAARQPPACQCVCWQTCLNNVYIIKLTYTYICIEIYNVYMFCPLFIRNIHI
jgi:hypothetical protein